MDLRMSVMTVAAMGGGGWLFWQGMRGFQIARLIENTPTAHIRSMAMGLVEVRGRPHARSSMLAPFSGHPCAYWEVDIAVSGRGKSWTTVHRNASGTPFYLEDDTGSALVYPQGAVCRVQHHRGGCLVDLARLDAHHAILDQIDAPHAVLAGDGADFGNQHSGREFLAVDRNR